MNNYDSNLKYNYKSLKDINLCSQLPNCMNRQNDTRSVKDIMDYQKYVLNMPVQLAPPSDNSEWGILGTRKCKN